GQADGQQGRPEDLSSAQRIRGRPARGARAAGASAEAGEARRGRGARHAAEDEARSGDVSKAEGVRRSGSSACGAETEQDHSGGRGARAGWGGVGAAVEYYGRGRRKTPTARVFLGPGPGAVPITHRAFAAFSPPEALRTQTRRPLVLTETADKFDILATVAGG